MRSLPVTLLILGIACAPPRGLSSRQDAILGGAADTTTTTVFLLDLRFDTSAASICSAVLISPRVLLTAAHCVDPTFHNATTVTVRATNKSDTVNLMQSDMIDVTVISRHPSWTPADQQSDFDFAALLLARAPSGVSPAPFLRALPAGAVGQALRVVGYGRTSVSDGTSSGTRRSVAVPVAAFTSAALSYGSDGASGICAGDSGGPSFLGEAVAGIHSRTEGANCGRGVDIRVDSQLAFVDAFVATNDPPTCTADGVCSTGCGATDPDCACLADQRCEASCGANDPDCTCLADQRCDANCGGSDPDCGCQADQRCDASCGLTDPDCLDDGAVCTAAAECAGGQCLEDPRGFSFCSRSCVSSSECLAEMTCQGELCRAPPDPSKGDEVQGGCASAPGLGLGGVPVWLMVVLMRRRLAA